MVVTENREPILFTQGDTLAFNKYLPDFLPSAGWALLYEIRSSDQPTNPAIQIQSTPDATNTFHEINVAVGITAGWLAGDAIMVGYVVNTDGTRHQIYYNNLEILPNLGTNTNAVDLSTHAQRMIPIIEKQLEELAAHSMDDSNVQSVEIRRVKRMELEKQLAWNKQLRQNEIAVANVTAGRPSGNKVVPVFNIIPYGGPGCSPQNPFFPNT